MRHNRLPRPFLWFPWHTVSSDPRMCCWWGDLSHSMRCLQLDGSFSVSHICHFHLFFNCMAWLLIMLGCAGKTPPFCSFPECCRLKCFDLVVFTHERQAHIWKDQYVQNLTKRTRMSSLYNTHCVVSVFPALRPSAHKLCWRMTAHHTSHILLCKHKAKFCVFLTSLIVPAYLSRSLLP